METMTFVPTISAEPFGMAQVVKRSFNRGFFDRNDPFDGVGIRLSGASSATSYRVERGKHAGVLSQLFGSVYARLRASSIPDVAVKLVDFDDAWIGDEAPRRYVVVEKDTPRGTRMHLDLNFRSYGDYLYVAIDAYVLPSLDVYRMLREWARMAYILYVALCLGKIIAMILSFVAGLAGLGGGIGGAGAAAVGVMPLLWIGIAGYLLYQFRDVLRSLSSGDTLPMALRRRYHRALHANTFDVDDVVAFYKSSALLALDAIVEVFEANGIPTDILTQVAATINLSTNVINNGGSMNVFGGVQGAAGNTATAGAPAAAAA